MQSVLIVSSGKKSSDTLYSLLSNAGYGKITSIQSCAQARRTLLSQRFELVVINAPLSDESGEAFAMDVAASNQSQVILLTRHEHYEAVTLATEEAGVLCVSKPIERALLWSALKLARAAGAGMRRMRDENETLKQRMEDIAVIDRAKMLLISHLAFSEAQAHRYIEKQAMDMRATKRAIAEEILKTYES